LLFGIRQISRDGDGRGPWVHVLDEKKITVATEDKKVPLSEMAARWISQEWFKVKAIHDIAEEKAQQVKLAMQQNEDKWDVACGLLGMKVNEFGALVPIKTAEETAEVPPTDELLVGEIGEAA
jgi:hypothetical protein